MPFKRGSSKLIWRYFLSYLIILIIPLSSMSYLMTGYVRETLTEDFLDTESSMLERYGELNDAQFKEIGTIAFRLSSDDEFVPHIILDHVKNSGSIMNKLKNLKIANNFISDIYLIIDGSDYVYSPLTTYTLERFINQKVESGVGTRLFSEKLHAIDRPVYDARIGFVGGEGRNIYCVMPLPVYESYAYGYLIFEVSVKSMLGIMDSFLTTPEQMMAVARDGELLACRNMEDTGLRGDVAERIRGTHPQSDSFEYAGRKYYYFEQKAEGFGFSYIRIVPQSSAYGKVERALVSLLKYISSILFVGFLLIYFFARLNYSPVRKLMSAVQESLGGGKRPGDSNEFQQIRLLVDEAGSSLSRLNQSMLTTRPAVRFYLLKNLLNGSCGNQEELRHLMRLSGLRFYSGSFFAVVFCLEKNCGDKARRAVMEYINEGMEPDLLGGAIESFQQDQVFAVLSCEGADPERVRGLLERRRAAMAAEMGVELTVGIGGLRESLLSLSKSFIEALAAADYRMVLGKGRVITVYEVNTDPCSYIRYPFEMMNKVCVGIKNGQTDGLQQSIQQLMDYIRQNASSLHVARLLCYDIVNQILRTMNELYSDYRYETVRAPSVMDLSRFETLEELETLLLGYCGDVCSYIGQHKNLPLHRLAVDYIHKHHTQPSFSVNSMAEALGISAAHLSRIFKEQMGVTLSSYITGYKIELAKQRLTETSESVESLVFALGYYDTSSFIRKFKKIVGVTPGEYRRLRESGQSVVK